jgi:dienelactone hydrolase
VTLDGPAAALADCPRQPPSAIADAVVRSATAAREIANVDPARVHLVGWGEGAIGVMAALGDPVRARRTGARSAAGFYPACANLAGWRVGIPFLMILAEDDTVAPPHACAALAERASGGNFVLAIRYGGAGHRFDVETPDAAPAWQFWRRRDDRFNPGVRDAALHDLRIFFDLPSP